MDMEHLGFHRAFDAILIPYNTLNLLTAEENIRRCLDGCRAALEVDGRLLVQLFIPTQPFPARNSFQFQMFDRPGGGRIIKEILKRPRPATQALEIEERFRIRPMQPGQANQDYHSIYRITALPLDHWLTLFTEAGFAPRHIWGSCDRKSYDPAASTCCLLELEKKVNFFTSLDLDQRT